MDNDTLRRVQLVLLEIVKEIKRVCDENGIRYYLDSGTLLGAVRHSGFIPWDDDLDIGMMRPDYDRFCRIAPKQLKPQYFLQNWDNDPQYGVPFAKVRKKHTIYLENKANKSMENGFYVDIFPYDNSPSSLNEKTRLMKRLSFIERIILMKCHYMPWNEGPSINLTKRVAYLPYQFLALFWGKRQLVKLYMRIVTRVKDNGEDVYLQYGAKKGFFQKRSFFGEGQYLLFEDTYFRCPINSDGYLRKQYGDYMILPPVDQRNNRHQIVEVKF